MAIGGAIGVGTTTAVSLASGVNPINGRMISQYNTSALKDLNIYGTQRGLKAEYLNKYLEQMRNGLFDTDTQIAGYKYDGKYIITDGHHRMAAAYRYYLETRDISYVLILQNRGSWDFSNPNNFGYKPNRIENYIIEK